MFVYYGYCNKDDFLNYKKILELNMMIIVESGCILMCRFLEFNILGWEVVCKCLEFFIVVVI